LKFRHSDFEFILKTKPNPFALSLSKGRSWFDKPVLSSAEGLTTNGIWRVKFHHSLVGTRPSNSV